MMRHLDGTDTLGEDLWASAATDRMLARAGQLDLEPPTERQPFAVWDGPDSVTRVVPLARPAWVTPVASPVRRSPSYLTETTLVSFQLPARPMAPRSLWSRVACWLAQLFAVVRDDLVVGR